MAPWPALVKLSARETIGKRALNAAFFVCGALALQLRWSSAAESLESVDFVWSLETVSRLYSAGVGYVLQRLLCRRI